ncbi:MAG: hypothetical protein V4643_07170 [Bacteroidota bacterium]
MNETKKWKSRLLSSSIPLEYEIGKMLSDMNFSVSFDYTYYRQEGGAKKEFSTDIKGYFLFPIGAENNLDASLTSLIECKYREEGKKWLFLRDVNKPETSIIDFGYTIKSLSEFSTVKNRDELIGSFENKFESALKGVEVSLTSGEVFDKDIRHGISQLKYALPYLVKNNIETNVFGHLVDTLPSYLISILVTNADLYILKENFSIDMLKKVEELEELANKVPYLICNSDIGPDFTDHHKEIFKDFFSNCKEGENLEIFEAFQKTKIRKYGLYDSPFRTCSNLEQSFYYALKKYYSQHFVCSFDHFPELMKQILKLLSRVTKTKQ